LTKHFDASVIIDSLRIIPATTNTIPAYAANVAATGFQARS